MTTIRNGAIPQAAVTPSFERCKDCGRLMANSVCVACSAAALPVAVRPLARAERRRAKRDGIKVDDKLVPVRDSRAFRLAIQRHMARWAVSHAKELSECTGNEAASKATKAFVMVALGPALDEVGANCFTETDIEAIYANDEFQKVWQLSMIMGVVKEFPSEFRPHSTAFHTLELQYSNSYPTDGYWFHCERCGLFGYRRRSWSRGGKYMPRFCSNKCLELKAEGR